MRLALEKGVAGTRYHGIAEEGIAFREIASVIGRNLGAPVSSKTPKEAAGFFSWLAPFAGTDNPVSGMLTQDRIGWQPVQPSLFAGLEQ